MRHLHSRRTFLRLGAGTAVATSLSGCLLGNEEVPGGHLFVGSSLGGPRRLWLTVVEDPEGNSEEVVDGLYRIPPQTVLQFDGVLQSDMTYSISARIPNTSTEERFDVTIETCDEDDPAEKMDVRIRANTDPNDIGIIHYRCDRTYNYEEDTEYVNASEYRIEDATPQET